MEEKGIYSEVLNKRKSVIDLITEMKSLSGLAIDLGFTALLMQDRKLAARVKELAQEMKVKEYQIQVECMLAAENPKDALSLTSVVNVASAVMTIMEGVNLLLSGIYTGMPLHPAISDALKKAANDINYMAVSKSSGINGKTLEEIMGLGVDILAMKRSDVWTYQPLMKERLQPDDIIVVSGAKKSIDSLRKIKQGENNKNNRKPHKAL